MATTFLVPKNNAATTLNGDINNSVTSIVVTASSVFPTTYPFHITIDSEIMEVNNNNTGTNTLTVEARNGDAAKCEGTAAATHSSGAVVRLNITAKAISDISTAVNTLEGCVYPSGSTFPTGSTGMLFTHSVTGRSILYEYDGSSWIPLYSIGAMTVYVDSTDGTDDRDHGTAVDASAFKTIQYAINQIPPIFTGNVSIYIAAGTYAESIGVVGKTPSGSYTISIYGTLIAHDAENQIMDGDGVKGATTSQSSVHKHGLSADHYQNQLIKFTSGTNNNLYRIVDSNTTTDLILVGTTLSAQPLTGDTFTIYDWGTIITTVTISDSQNFVYLYDLKVDASSAAALTVGLNAVVYINRCWFNGSGFLFYSQRRGSIKPYWSFLSSTTGSVVGYHCENSLCEYKSCKVTVTNGTGLTSASCSYVDINACVIDGITKATQVGISSTGVSSFVCSGSPYNIIRHLGTGVTASTGGQVTGTSANVYTDNTADESATAASYGYID
jgi:hypothetical protein